MHKDLGFGPDLVDPETRIVYPTIAKLALKHQKKNGDLSRGIASFMLLAQAGTAVFAGHGKISGNKLKTGWKEPGNEWSLPVFAADRKTHDWIGPISRHKAGLELQKLANWEGSFPRNI